MEKMQGRSYCLHSQRAGGVGRPRELLKELGIAFDFVYVDLLPPEEMDDTIAIIEKFNPAGSFPTLIIDDKKVIVGFREEEIRGAFRK